MRWIRTLVIAAVLVVIGVAAQDRQTTDEGHAAISYPVGWFGGEHGDDLVFANRREVLNAQAGELLPGDVSGRVLALPLRTLNTEGLQRDSTPEEILDAFVGSMLQQATDENNVFSQAVTLIYEDRQVAYTQGALLFGGQGLDVYIAAIVTKNAFGVVTMLANQPEEDLRDVLRFVSLSFTYDLNPNVRVLTLPQPDGVDYTARYPAGWFGDVVNDTIVMGNTEDALEKISDNVGVPVDDEAGGAVLLVSPELLEGFDYPLTVTGAMDFMLWAYELDDETDASFGTIDDLLINDQSAQKAYAVFSKDGIDYDGLLIVVEVGDLWGVVIFASPLGTISDYEFMAFDVAASIKQG